MRAHQQQAYDPSNPAKTADTAVYPGAAKIPTVRWLSQSVIQMFKETVFQVNFYIFLSFTAKFLLNIFNAYHRT